MRGSPLSPGNTSHPPRKGDQAPAKSRHLLPRPVISIGPSRARRSASGAKWGVKGEGEGGIQSASPARPASVCGEVCSVLQFPRRWTRCSPRGEEMGEWVGLAVANDDRTSHDDRSVEREVIQFPSLTLAGLARRVPLPVSTGSPEQRRFSPDQPLPHFQRGAFPAETAVELSGKERTGGAGEGSYRWGHAPRPQDSTVCELRREKEAGALFGCNRQRISAVVPCLLAGGRLVGEACTAWMTRVGIGFLPD